MKTHLGKILAGLVVLALLIPVLASCEDASIPTGVLTSEPTATAAPPPTLQPTATPLLTPEPTAVPESELVTLRVGTIYIWDTINPNIAWYGYGIRYLMYDALVGTDKLAHYAPELAKNWQVSDDGLVWTFEIQEGVTFHNGEPCTAEEIAWSINWMIEVGTDSLSYLFAQFAQVEALDSTTLQITLYEPVGNMEYLSYWTWIIPESVWGGMTYDEVAEYDTLLAGIGTGPYKLVEWVEGEYLILEAYEDYWRGKPPIDRIIYQEYATEDLMVHALLGGEIDVMDSVPSTAIELLQDEQDVQVVVMDSYGLDELSINTHEDGTQPESLNDPVVRLAIEYAIDRQTIINVAYAGYAQPGTTMIAPILGEWHNDGIDVVPFDVDEAKRILDAAGYVDSDGDGVREYSDGNSLEYRLMAGDSATDARIAEIISNGLRDIGIFAIVELLDYDSQSALAYEFDFDLNYWVWGMDMDPDFGMVVFLCEQREDWGWNDSGYCDQEFEEMYLQQLSAVDHETRLDLIWRMQEKIYQARPWIVLTYPQTIQAYRSDRFTGFEAEAGSILAPWSIMHVEPVQ